MEILVNKAALGELTLGDIWDLVKDRVHSVQVEESEFKWGPYETISFVPGVRLEVSSGPISEEDQEPEYSFDLKTKVRVKGDHLELVYEDKYGGEESLSVYFMHQPEPQAIGLDFLLPGGGK